MFDTWKLIGCLLIGGAGTAPALAAETVSEVQDLEELSIEELADLPVRSASKREEPLSQAPTALYVITADDIHDSGARSLPEALRLAPNLQVQQVDASQYAITARGFNGTETANKLLVLIDGRSIYTPLQSQVFWNLHSPLLEDINQIEVISGPGGTLYGPNAVNGVVSITSRDSQETLGTLMRATAGAYERTAGARHGFALGGAGTARIYANWHDRENLAGGSAIVDGNDAYRGWQAGFRSDFGGEASHLTVQGDLFRNTSRLADGDGNRGHNLLARWSRTLGTDASMQVQVYYDRFEREFTLVRDSLQTLDGEAQLNLTSGVHELVVGAGARRTRDAFINDLNIFQLDPNRKTVWVANAFAQDRVALSPTVSLTAGAKLERSTFTGWQVLPNARLAWQPGDRTLLWAAVSRAVRNPARVDTSLSAPPLLERNEDFRSEKLVAFEVGYRGRPSEALTLSVNAFYNRYDDIRTLEYSPGGGLPLLLSNGIEGRSYGFGAWANAQILPGWRASVGGTTLWKSFDEKPGRTDLAGLAAIGDDPRYQLVAATQIDLAPKLELALNGRHVGRIRTDPAIPAYTELGGRLAYGVTDRFELFVAGRNLLHRDHAESNDINQAQRPQRSVYGGTRIRF